MADREQIAATLAAALIEPVDIAGDLSPARERNISKAAVDAVAMYQAILAELAKQAPERRPRSLRKTLR
jgi:hypothetical protein